MCFLLTFLDDLGNSGASGFVNREGSPAYMLLVEYNGEVGGIVSTWKRVTLLI